MPIIAFGETGTSPGPRFATAIAASFPRLIPDRASIASAIRITTIPTPTSAYPMNFEPGAGTVTLPIGVDASTIPFPLLADDPAAGFPPAFAAMVAGAFPEELDAEKAKSEGAPEATPIPGCVTGA